MRTRGSGAQIAFAMLFTAFFATLLLSGNRQAAKRYAGGAVPKFRKRVRLRNLGTGTSSMISKRPESSGSAPGCVSGRANAFPPVWSARQMGRREGHFQAAANLERRNRRLGRQLARGGIVWGSEERSR